jgi:hypothetical protein
VAAGKKDQMTLRHIMQQPAAGANNGAMLASGGVEVRSD